MKDEFVEKLKMYGVVRGLLQASEKVALLDQITGPTQEGHHAAQPATP